MAVADILGKPVSRDTIAALRRAGLIATGPRSPQPGAPDTYVTTPAFLEFWHCQACATCPIFDRLEEAGSARQGAAAATSCVARSASSMMPKRKRWRRLKRMTNWISGRSKSLAQPLIQPQPERRACRILKNFL